MANGQRTRGHAAGAAGWAGTAQKSTGMPHVHPTVNSNPRPVTVAIGFKGQERQHLPATLNLLL